MVKAIGFICSKTGLPTVTVTGMVVISPAVSKSNCATKVPAIAPPFGSWLAVTPTVTRDGAVPLAADTVSHAPLSEVVGVAVQFNVPEPPFPIWMTCEVVVPLVLNEKLSPPGGLLKNAPEDAIVTVTVTFIVLAGVAYSAILISPL